MAVDRSAEADASAESDERVDPASAGGGGASVSGEGSRGGRSSRGQAPGWAGAGAALSMMRPARGSFADHTSGLPSAWFTRSRCQVNLSGLTAT